MGCISTILHRGSFTIPLPQVMHTQNIYIFASFITLVVCVAVGLEIYINSSPVFLALSLEQRQRCGASVIPVCGSIFSPLLRSLLLHCCGSILFCSVAAQFFSAVLQLNFFLQCCSSIFSCSVAA